MTRPASSQSDGARSGDALVVADSDERLPDLSSAMRALAKHLEFAMAGMAPDDVVIEVDVDQDGTKSSAHLRFRAYKHRPTE
jgi:hypothetical protein